MTDRSALPSRRLVLEIRMNRLLANIVDASTRILHPDRLDHTCPFSILVDDVILYMAKKFLGRHEIWAFSLVAHRYNILLTPILYTNIPLLLRRTERHNDGSTNNRDSLLLSQKGLRNTLKLRPHLNNCIRSLEWYLDNKEIRTTLIELIRPMKHLERIHLCTPYGSPLCPDKTPPHFLLLCTSVTLEGIISFEFAKLIINPATTQYLSLDLSPRWMKPISDWISCTSALFSSLTTLELRFPGGNQLIESQQIELLTFWKHALVALSGQLVHVIIASRITGDRNSARRACQPTVSLLITHLFPVFFEQRWPHLQKLTLVGANMVISLGPGIYDQLKTVTPQVVVVAQADLNDFLWHNHFAYNENLR